MSSTSILLRGGTVLLHDKDNHVQPTVTDVLVEGNITKKIAESIAPVSDDTKVVDCTGKIISPGFISTHHHLYQTSMKGLHANHNLLEYFGPGMFIGQLFTLEDAFWGELSGAMEAVDSGTTTVVDHSHLNPSRDHPKTVIQALATSGLRTIYCYTAPRETSFSPFSCKEDNFSPAFLGNYDALAASAPFADGRVRLGFATDATYMPKEVLAGWFGHVRAAKTALITTHGAGGAAWGGSPSAAQILGGHGLLGPDVVISHANATKPGDGELLAASGASVSTTPNTEMQMGWAPIALRPEFRGHASLGVDCHSWGTGFMPGQMRMALQHARLERGADLLAQGKWSRKVGPTVEDAFNLGTVAGAAAVGMADQVGRVAEGFRADLVVFDADSPAMLVAAEEDPVAAVVLHSSERDVGMVIVDGVVRKENGRLVDVVGAAEVCGGASIGVSGRTITWPEVAAEVRKSRLRLKEKSGAIDMKAVEEAVLDHMFMKRDLMIESAGNV